MTEAYTLTNSWDGAKRRLGLLESHTDPISHRRLAGTGVSGGWRCLEVGGGLGSIARWLSDRVGATGAVTVTDLDTRFLESLRAENVSVLKHDVIRDSLPEAHFDLIHARWLLYHLTAPSEVCARLARALRPGGYLVLEDVDFYPLQAARDQEFAAVMHEVANAVGAAVGHGGVWAARAIPEMLDQAGLVELQCDTAVDALHGGSAMAEFWRYTGAQIRPRVELVEGCDMRRFDRVMSLLATPAFSSVGCAHVGFSARRAA
jgi:SAM-dependent methyltransferase